MVSAAGISLASSLTASTVSDYTSRFGAGRVIPSAFHTAEFAIFALFTYRLLSLRVHWPFHFLALLTLGLAAGYGAIDELHQATVAGRYSSLEDVAVDTLGAAVAIAVIAIARWLPAMWTRGVSHP